jgi:hypothetical protein
MLQTLLILLAVAALAATAINVWAVLPLPGGKPRPRPFSASIAAYLYFAAAIVFLILRVRIRAAPLNPSTVQGAPHLAQATGRPLAQGITWLAALAAVLVLSVAAVLAARWWRSLNGTPADVEPRGEAAGIRNRLAVAAGESLDVLRAEADPRRAVIAAYARLETEMDKIGRARRPSEAPLEFTARILGELRLDTLALRRLTDLFEWARFSEHQVDRRMKEEAIDALLRVRAGLDTR